MKTRLLVIAAMLPLSGCISFGAKPPPELLTLEAATPPAVGKVQDTANARAIVVDTIASPAALATARIPVQESATAIAYVKNAQWSEPPAPLFARLLGDTITANTSMVVLSSIQSIGEPSATLSGSLRNFGIDAATREAVVTYDAALTQPRETSIAKRRFEARVPVAAIDATNAGVALNNAANQVAGEVAQWVEGQR
jgi:cholesterol transport system auxiliary component